MEAMPSDGGTREEKTRFGCFHLLSMDQSASFLFTV